MNNKYTFWSLCKSYNKIEVPIIQRDYAQGRQTAEVNILREKFINDFLINSIIKEQPIELDFVYGSILTEVKDDIRQKVFIPLDGQQRLTTLFLLYYFIAVKENRLNDVKEILSKFTYETRPSAHDFCKKLLDFDQVNNIAEIKNQIEDSVWFNDEWRNDPTVFGMLNMLDTFSKNPSLINSNLKLLDKIIDDDKQLISFYFTDLEEFGLTENLYIRMNARGKMLTDFENFKSEFSKIIQYNHILLEQVKDKIEYLWVENLWNYKEENSYIIDAPFMSYLSFITEMLYFKDAEYRSSKTYETNFLDFRLLKTIYSIEDNLRFLIFSFDFIKEIKENKESVLWDGESLSQILKDIIDGKRDTTQLFILFLALRYSYYKKTKENLNDYVRVVRNLIVNTDDNSRREWSRLISSLHNLISDDNVYQLLSELSDDNKLIGFNVDQRKEEIFKAKLFLNFASFKNELFKIEDHKYLTGRITNLLLSPFTKTEEDFKIVELQNVVYTGKEVEILLSIFSAYEEIARDNFNRVRGNLLITGLYKQTGDSRIIYESFRRHPSIILFAKHFATLSDKLSLYEFLVDIQKQFILKMINKYEDLSLIRNAKEQLYIYYIIGERIYNYSYTSFFKNYNFNIGWLEKVTGYKSYFTKGIEGCQYFPDTNPIFQFYNQQFRYNLGINPNNTLDIEMIGGNKKREPFKLIIEWASK